MKSKEVNILKTIHLTKQQAKNFMANYHFINSSSTLQGDEGIKKVFNRLHSIQYDPLDVVGKNVDLVLQSRVEDYKKGAINKLLYSERYLVDGWDKQMSVYQTDDFHKMQRVRISRSRSEVDTMKYRVQNEAFEYEEEILEIIKNEGPKYSTEFKMGKSTKHRWGHAKPSSATLSYLFHQGKLLIRTRRNTQKQFDLVENLIPNEIVKTDPFLSDDVFIEYYLQRRIESMGLISNKNGVHFSGPFIAKKTLRNKYLKVLTDKGLIVKCSIGDLNGEFYIVSSYEKFLLKTNDTVSFIAPLDNMIWDRNLIKTLYDFEYTWEVYTPVLKRKYGYYVLPIIYGNQFIGRIEFEKNRNGEPIRTINIFFEERFKLDTNIKKSIGDATEKFSRYLS